MKVKKNDEQKVTKLIQEHQTSFVAKNDKVKIIHDIVDLFFSGSENKKKHKISALLDKIKHQQNNQCVALLSLIQVCRDDKEIKIALKRSGMTLNSLMIMLFKTYKEQELENFNGVKTILEKKDLISQQKNKHKTFLFSHKDQTAIMKLFWDNINIQGAKDSRIEIFNKYNRLVNDKILTYYQFMLSFLAILYVDDIDRGFNNMNTKTIASMIEVLNQLCEKKNVILNKNKKNDIFNKKNDQYEQPAISDVALKTLQTEKAYYDSTVDDNITNELGAIFNDAKTNINNYAICPMSIACKTTEQKKQFVSQVLTKDRDYKKYGNELFISKLVCDIQKNYHNQLNYWQAMYYIWNYHYNHILKHKDMTFNGACIIDNNNIIKSAKEFCNNFVMTMLEFVAEITENTPNESNVDNNKNNPYTQNANSALGYDQGKASTPDACINEFIEYIKNNKINPVNQKFSLENNSKYDFIIDKCENDISQEIEDKFSSNIKFLTYDTPEQTNEKKKERQKFYKIIAVEKNAKEQQQNKRVVYEGQIENGKMSGIGKLILKKDNNQDDEY